jgi:hypothetical protein
LPHALIDLEGADGDANDKISWLENQGVQIIPHRASLVAELIPTFGEKMKTYSGHWLRCDIPLIETADKFVLYTDIDVVFEADVTLDAPEPPILACGPEHNQGDLSYFNSGVMIMNVAGFGACREAMIRTLRARLTTTAPYDDQSMLNELLMGKWDGLDDRWNWKPYWGRNDGALIVHWHGPKPEHVNEMLAGNQAKFGSDYETIFKKNVPGYRYYLDRFGRL